MQGAKGNIATRYQPGFYYILSVLLSLMLLILGIMSAGLPRIAQSSAAAVGERWLRSPRCRSQK
ncbi:hypothetical protein [Laspinema olomoucense]|uniref:hypothetical protein n=1 Tax=Laspinema olomoucense TaxID=3231600 RepID=UPI0021BA43CA|nr:hypothetical protein [Laspinema sp. D3a]MCT7990889.1 hypothetical protein [Laspinema sp. D3a]